ncbi:MAG: 5'/3'-nucleotidase SurE [Cytophagales bacterium]
MANKPLILVTNDDGITSKGIKTLIEAVMGLGEVVVVAPDSPQSGMGHAITISKPLRLNPNTMFGDIEAYECSGTPADCVKIAKNFVLKGRKIDLVVSGINHGTNASINVIYSGTMSAAIEAAIESIPAIGFSLCDYASDADFSHTTIYIQKIVNETLTRGIGKYTALNVNIPAMATAIKGFKICRQAVTKYQEEFERRTDPMGRQYFWTAGALINMDNGEDTDEWALENGFISIVPCQFDLTAHHSISILNSEWKLN